MAFDIEQLTEFAIQSINDFARNHQEETFYGFSICDGLLSLNSIEQFRLTLERYQRGRFGAHYQTAEKIADLRANSGDWEYMGFARFDGQPGYNEELYDEHYDIGLDDPWDSTLRMTPYAQAMDAVIRNLIARKAFAPLRLTLDFTAKREEHSY